MLGNSSLRSSEASDLSCRVLAQAQARARASSATSLAQHGSSGLLSGSQHTLSLGLFVGTGYRELPHIPSVEKPEKASK